jgi:hypothetical protein
MRRTELDVAARARDRASHAPADGVALHDRHVVVVAESESDAQPPHPRPYHQQTSSSGWLVTHVVGPLDADGLNRVMEYI